MTSLKDSILLQSYFEALFVGDFHFHSLPLTKHRWLFKTLVSTFLLITSLTCYSRSVSDFISCYVSI